MTKRVNCSALDNEHVIELGIFFNFQTYNRLKCKHDIYIYIYVYVYFIYIFLERE
jgi:hypothetical protein